MTAAEARVRIMALFSDLRSQGVNIGGHWDDSVILLIHTDDPNDGYSEITDEDFQ